MTRGPDQEVPHLMGNGTLEQDRKSSSDARRCPVHAVAEDRRE
jgi:hypothetical protein